jgi:predicted nucleic acid-binding protein
MVLVDTTVWIDFFQHPASQNADKLEKLIRGFNQAALCGIVLQEVLQGIKDSKSFATTKERLQKLPYLDMGKDVYLAAAILYRSLRSKGVTVPSTDTAIAALAILNRIPLFTSDEHFSIIAEHSRLKLYM